jgi:very-short-patch-repair endonuclease
MTDKSDTFLYYWKVVAHRSNLDTPEREYRFHPERKWRFDFAWPHALIAVEVDGNAWHTKGGGRHGKDSDREKINAAASLGWRVFHFSPTMLESDPTTCITMVMGALE